MFRLRYQAHDLELPLGEFVIGRSTECQLSVDDPLVSRRHAVLRVTRDAVTVEDLGSRNGVQVNGGKVEGERALLVGERLSIGGQDMVLQAGDLAMPARSPDDVYRRATQTLGAVHAQDFRVVMAEERTALGSEPSPATDATRSRQSFRLLGGVADKALALGRAEEAERILQALLVEIITRARDGHPIDAAVAESAARYAARLGGGTTKGAWVDYVFDLYSIARRPVPAPVVDELYTVVRKVKSIDVTLLRSYLAALREASSAYGPAERFLMQRLEGLERLVSLK